MDAKMLMYIQSESEFSRASHQGFWEVVRGLFSRRDPYLLCFNDVVNRLCPGQAEDRGVQDIPVAAIVGSAGRHKNFTRHFLPRIHDARSKERWRNIFTLAVTGAGFPPIEVYKVGSSYFVEDGHHRVSVAKYLKWDSIQSHVTELPLTNEADFFNRLDNRQYSACNN